MSRKLEKRWLQNISLLTESPAGAWRWLYFARMRYGKYTAYGPVL